MKKHKGFTLIELMITVVIVAILASIAIPSYSAYVLRSNRRAAQATMMEISTRQHQFFAANRAYASAVDLGFTLPPEVAANYTMGIALAAGPPPGFTITFTPTGRQVADGAALTLTGAGVKGPAGKW